MKQNLKDIGLAFILWGLFITSVLILTNLTNERFIRLQQI